MTYWNEKSYGNPSIGYSDYQDGESVVEHDASSEGKPTACNSFDLI